MASDTEITKVRIVIRHLLWQIREVRNDRDAAWEWVNRFANTLQYQDLEQDPDQYALAILAEARSFNDQKKRNQQMRWVREQLAKEGVTRPTQEQLDEKWLEMYGNEESPQDAPNGNAGVDMTDARNGAASKSPTSCETFTADGDTREHSRGRYAPPSCSPDDGSHYGDAATREGADESTTVSRNMRRVPQTEAPAHGFSGGRTAQGTMSRSPEAAAQSGKDYDQESSISTDDPQPEGLTGPSHGGSVASLEALESQRRAGADSLRSYCHSAPVRLPSFDEFTAFIDAQGLDYTDAREWWEMTMVDRDGKDRDGNTIGNWKGALKRFCKNRAAKRSKGEVK